MDFLKFSPNFTWPKSWHVCSGIGHRLPIIDSFPSLLGALHIGPIPWLVALLVAGRRTSQFVFVSSLHLLKHPKIQRFRGSLSQRSDIKDLAWVDLAVLAFLACQEGSKWQWGCHYTSQHLDSTQYLLLVLPLAPTSYPTLAALQAKSVDRQSRGVPGWYLKLTVGPACLLAGSATFARKDRLSSRSTYLSPWSPVDFEALEKGLNFRKRENKDWQFLESVGWLVGWLPLWGSGKLCQESRGERDF